MYWALLAILLYLLAACGKTGKSSGNLQREETTPDQSGYYRAPFILLNKSIVRNVSGRGSVFINERQFYVKVNFKSKWSSVVHPQYLHLGNRCPTMSDDINNDGHIDGREVAGTIGEAIIPLDWDLRSPVGKRDKFPSSDEDGDFIWSRAASSSSIIRDLLLSGAISRREDVRMEGRVVMVYGIPESIALPESVQGISDYTPNMSYPIACGILIPTDETFP